MPRVSTGNTSEKAFFLSFTEDQFYLTPQGLDMAAFFKNLRTGGTLRNFDEKTTGALLDIYGTPVAGKRLSDFLYRSWINSKSITVSARARSGGWRPRVKPSLTYCWNASAFTP